MSSTDTRTVDPAEPHHSENGGHEMSDFSWTTVLWLIPLAAVLLVIFVFVSVAWFKGAKDKELDQKRGALVTTELNLLRVKENETLTQYKYLDKDKGRVQIPIARAMELIAQEHINSTGKDWKPITDTYLQGAAFQSASVPTSMKAPESGISIDTAADATSAAGAKGHHNESRHVVPAAAEKKGH